MDPIYDNPALHSVISNLKPIPVVECMAYKSRHRDRAITDASPLRHRYYVTVFTYKTKVSGKMEHLKVNC